MTELLYLDDTDTREFEARVERVLDDRVVLDRTAFYPTGGGQPNDTGTLVADANADGDSDGDGDTSTSETWTVTDVSKKDTVYHTLAGEPPAEGTTVTGRLDWDRRYAHMKYHTAQHLLSALLLSEYDAETTGNQLYADRAYLDCAYERFDDDDLADIESRLNDLVADAMPVRWYVMDRDEAEASLDPERTRLHLLPDSITEIRMVEIGPEDDPYDRTACAGTHVENTDELGTVEVTGRETKGGEKERVKFRLV
ncbi:alanyl-tRNA editing protein [Haloprofundus marisrubri]|uniref:Alanyl-tRNA editing protein n=1 Tax=Haloprofundus marisrubri TaxID=1514971 RepID=A0A0W1R8X7_9EURY|nr:alanyl-tRNA editing protein [Haloprofundus marisrubri]KTG09819.1 alanyl-tRNA editing protein [Haloprofundus marisrubri]